jgi:hypothetical protein
VVNLRRSADDGDAAACLEYARDHCRAGGDRVHYLRHGLAVASDDGAEVCQTCVLEMTYMLGCALLEPERDWSDDAMGVYYLMSAGLSCHVESCRRLAEWMLAKGNFVEWQAWTDRYQTLVSAGLRRARRARGS